MTKVRKIGMNRRNKNKNKDGYKTKKTQNLAYLLSPNKIKRIKM